MFWQTDEVQFKASPPTEQMIHFPQVVKELPAKAFLEYNFQIKQYIRSLNSGLNKVKEGEENISVLQKEAYEGEYSLLAMGCGQ